jgi:hypothetical protein
MYTRLYPNNLKIDEFQFCLHSTLGMHEGLQKIMSKLMLNRIFNEWWGIILSFQNFVEIILFALNYTYLLKL